MPIRADALTLVSTTNASGSGTGGALNVFGGAFISKDVYIDGDLIVNGITYNPSNSFQNIVVLDATPSKDGGVAVKRYNDGLNATSGTSYASVYYSESMDEYTFATVNATASNLTVSQYLPLRAKALTLNSTTNATGIGSGGTLTVLGGGAVSKDFYVGNTFSSAVITSASAWITNAVITNLSVSNSNISGSGGTTVLETYYTESLFNSLTTSNAFQQKISTSTGSLSASTYLLQISYQMQVSNANGQYEVRFSLNGTPEYTSAMTHTNNTDNPFFQSFFYKNLNAGSQTLLLEFRKRSGAGSVTISNAKVLMFKLAVLENYYYESLFVSSTTSTSFQTKFILYTFQITTSADLVSYQTRLSIDGTPEITSSFTNQKSSDSPIFTHVIVKTFSSGTRSLLLEYRRSSATGSVSISNAKIVIFRLE
jgi:hypothetical protein